MRCEVKAGEENLPSVICRIECEVTVIRVHSNTAEQCSAEQGALALSIEYPQGLQSSQALDP